MSLLIRLTDAQVRQAISGAEIEYDGDYTARSIIEEIGTHQTCGSEVKTLLQEMADICFGASTPEYDSVYNYTLEHRLKDNMDFFRQNVYINGENALGMPEPSVAEVLPEVPGNLLEDTESEDTDSEEVYYDPIEEWGGDERDSGPTVQEDTDDLKIDTFFQFTDDDDDEQEADNETNTDADETLDDEEEESEYEDRTEIINYAESIEEAQKFYNIIKEQLSSAEDEYADIYFETSTDNMIYEDADITANDNISLSINISNDTICDDFCLVVNEQGEVVITGRFIHKENEEQNCYYLEAQQKNVEFEKIRQSGIRYHAIFTNEEFSDFYCGVIDLHLRRSEVSDKVLCIDFGTSNTTCGIYTDGGIRIVRFEDVTTQAHRSSNLCPTLVYVNKIHKKNPETGRAEAVEYLFGYEARRMMLENNYNPSGTVFFEIKRWITSPDELEEISDGTTNAYTSRKEIISAYLHYIVAMAESDLRCKFYRLHFSAPVKLKSKFIHLLQDELFSGEVAGRHYEVMSAQESIDEGVAIIYNHISESISHAERTNTHTAADGKILIVDCGGGTTDLASCAYSYTKKNIGYDLRLETRFENGNSNFGGNNITYRIFQYLKVRIASVFKSGINTNISVSDLLETNEDEALNIVDNCIREGTALTIYDRLDQLSREYEEILPTDFNGSSVYAKRSRSKQQTKRNFYFLWQLAEKIKVAIFTRTDISSIILNPSQDGEYCGGLVLDDEMEFYFKNQTSTMPPLKLTVLPEAVTFIINTKEINNLIRPDIYYLLESIFSLEDEDALNQYDYIKLAGQSCKIDLFRTLLKEFVPGRKLRMGNTFASGASPSEKFKLDCVCGSIIYIRDKEFHRINSFNKQTNQNLIFDVEISRGGMGSRKLINGAAINDQLKNSSVQKIDVEHYKAHPGQLSLRVLRNTGDKRQENAFNVPIFFEKYDMQRVALDQSNPYENTATLRQMILEHCYPVMAEEELSGGGTVSELIRQLNQTALTPGESQILVFAVPNNDGYSFMLYQLLKSNENGTQVYYLTYRGSHTFEDGISFKSFFNGKNCEPETV